MMTRPLVSVVILVYNGEAYIREALESVYRQDYPAIEVLVIDDGSTDGTMAIVEQFKTVVPVSLVHGGQARARNIGIQRAQGEWIAFLDHDDVWPETSLSLRVDAITRHGYEFVLGYMTSFLDGLTQWPAALEESVYRRAVGFLPGTLLAKRDLFRRIGVFDESYDISHDGDWFARAIDAKIPWGVVDEVVLKKRFHSCNMSYQTSKIQSELLRILRRSVARKRQS